jgi:predicted nuclease of predicted toxin-antitoxin system
MAGDPLRLLLDQNLSYRLAKKLRGTFQEVKHVNELRLGDASDRQIWQFAKVQRHILVTFDSDFFDLSLTHGHPPKLIWLRVPDQTTSNVFKLLSERASLIQEFAADPTISCLEVIG